MGFLQEEYGMMIIGRTPPGTCPMCAVKHPPEQPHNCNSLTYQYKFYDEHGRWPTWTDALAHCSDDIKAFWRLELEKRGVSVDI